MGTQPVKLQAPPSVELLDHLILDADRDMPLHAQLRRALRAIIDEQCVDGQKFFTEPQLIERLKVSQSTVRRALLDLARDGVLHRLVAKGSFVQKSGPKSSAAFRVTVYVPEWNSEFLMAMLEALSGECKRVGWRFRVRHTHQGEGGGGGIKERGRAMEGGPGEEGIILLANEPRATLDLSEVFAERSYRVVNIDTLVPGYRGAFIDTSNAEIIRIGLDHLTGLGHRRIALLINEPEEHGNVIERTRFFEKETGERGLKGAKIFHCGIHFFEDSYQAAYRKMPELMKNEPFPTAIFAISDSGAWAALKWLAENQIKVPDQISVLGFNDDRPSRFTHPALTTIAHPIAEIARSAVELLAAPGGPPVSRLLSPELVVRESTGPVRDC